MTSVEITAERDYLQKIARSKPYLAIAELIWNALDGDSTVVDVAYVGDEIGTERIVISDNGDGFSRSTAETYFGKLGGSWKGTASESAGGRILHGKNGQGRFKAFSLGDRVVWKTIYKKNNELYYYEIRGQESRINHFDITEEERIEDGSTGVKVEISDLYKNYRILDDDLSLQTFPSVFAPYISTYPEITIRFNGIVMNIDEQKKNEVEYDLSKSIIVEDKQYNFRLKLIEWDTLKTRELFFCDSSGFPLKKYEKQIRYIGDYGFAGYLRSEYFDELSRNGDLDLIDMNDELIPIIHEGIKEVKRYFSDRYIEDQKSVIDTWKQEKVYPYEESVDEDSVQGAEKKVFDILALSLNNHVDDFNEVNKTQKELQFRLLKQAIETSPSDLGEILTEVISLPPKVVEELKEILEHSSLTSIISASKTITDRIKFIRGIEEIVFDVELKKRLKERSQLHKILSDNTWLFGDEFFLSVNDQSLTEVLRKHSELLSDNIHIDEKVIRLDNSVGIVDLMLSRKIPKNHSNEFEHLVIELKAPRVRIGQKEITQIESYAMAVANDERFRGLNGKWEFWVISNDLDQYAIFRTNQSAYPKNTVIEYSKEIHYVVKVKTWSTVLAEAKHRHEFVRDQLKLNIDNEDGLVFLKKKYSEYVGELIAEVKPSDEIGSDTDR